MGSILKGGNALLMEQILPKVLPPVEEEGQNERQNYLHRKCTN